MLEYAAPIGFALFIWWFSTGAVIYLDGLPRSTFRWSMLGATLVAIAAIYGVWATRSDTSVTGAYLGFTCGLLLWGWNEMSFLMGFITGSRRSVCPENCSGWRRFIYASETLIHHELAIAATGFAVIALVWESANQVALWTFAALWGMRISAKLNVFLGVPNLTEEFLPENLQFLKTYFKNRPMNLLFPFSITAATMITVQLFVGAAAPEKAPFEVAGYLLVAALMALAVLEHWFMVLPIQDAALWRWALASRAKRNHSSKSPDLEADKDNSVVSLPHSRLPEPVRMRCNAFRV